MFGRSRPRSTWHVDRIWRRCPAWNQAGRATAAVAAEIAAAVVGLAETHDDDCGGGDDESAAVAVENGLSLGRTGLTRTDRDRRKAPWKLEA